MTYNYKDTTVELTIEQEAKQMNDEIVDRLIAYRKQLKMTQQDVADATGIQRANIARIERKKSMASIESLKKYARSVGIELRFETYRPDKGERLPLPVGCSDFRKVSLKYCYVDKTLFIKEILDEATQVSLFTRPRRFGKTLNMDMLRVFFEKTDEDTSIYFMDKKIWECGERYTEHQGKYPVIWLTFKDARYATWEECLSYLRFVFATEFNRHPELFDSENCNDFEKRYFTRIANGEASEMELTQALAVLTLMLDKHHGISPIVIIDEYDCPVQQGYINGFYNEAILFIRNLFSNGFKDNRHLTYGFMTGILRITKESIFSGLNNIRVRTILEDKYSRYFGFTSDEVRRLTEYYGVLEKYDEICEWYDGYCFGESHIFNPWSVVCYFNSDCTPDAYWSATSSNDIIGEILDEATEEIRESLQLLLQGKTICISANTGVIYPNIKKNPDSVYSFLLLSGYLKISRKKQVSQGKYMYEIGIPNLEVLSIYREEILARLKEVISLSNSDIICTAMIENNVDVLHEQLQRILIQSVSYLDVANESFYHGFMLGLCALLTDGYYITSNRESGEGRFDIGLMPRRKELPGILIEVKSTKECSEEKLTQLAQDALMQIQERQYGEEMKQQDVRTILAYGVAFCGKKVRLVTKIYEYVS